MAELARKAPAISAAHIELWVSGEMVGRAGIVVAGDVWPEVVMVDGLPFVPAPELGNEAYRYVRPYCVSAPR